MTSNETTKMTTKVSTDMKTRTKDEIFKEMESLIWKIFGDGSIGLPMNDSKFVDEDGFTLGSTTAGRLDYNYTIDYTLKGICMDGDWDNINDLINDGSWKKLYEEYCECCNVSTHMETETNDKIYTTSTSSDEDSSDEESSDEESSDEESRELHEYVVYVETIVYGRYIITAYDKQDALDTYDDGEYEMINECQLLPSRCEEL